MASLAIQKGNVSLNGSKALKQSLPVKIGDRILIAKSKTIIRVTVLSLATKREKYDIAKNMYQKLEDELFTSMQTNSVQKTLLDEDHGRPSKKDRRNLLKLKNSYSPLKDA